MLSNHSKHEIIGPWEMNISLKAEIFKSCVNDSYIEYFRWEYT